MKANLANRPSIERLRQAVDYDPETGRLLWRISYRRAVAGNEAGGIDPTTGYHRFSLDGSLILSHHGVWAWHHGVWPERIDHIRGKEAGNRIDNLRESTQSQNMANSGMFSHNTSGFKGVSWHKVTGKWQSQIRVKGKQLCLGFYATKEEAAQVYAAAALEHFGEFARAQNLENSAPKDVDP